MDLISKLPRDLVLYIYKEYLELHCTLQDIEFLLHTNDSRQLNILLIRPCLPRILANKRLCDYLCNNLVTKDYNIGLRYFETVYQYHKIQKKKNYLNATNGDSFALSLLVYLYH